MSLDRKKTVPHLKSADFYSLFIEELGWDIPTPRNPEKIELESQKFSLIPVAEKRGVRIFRCDKIPERRVRQKIEKEITKQAFEHLIIFLDDKNEKQIWQWVAREKGKPDVFREHSWLTDRSPEPLLQKLEHITFSLEEEEGLTLAGTVSSLRDAFDREEITKRFYDVFKKQHDKFLGFIKGLDSADDKQWYASLMLNRLMFVYFIQKKGFLDDDKNYLRNRLDQVQKTQGKGKFHSFYRAFLLKLFHGGLAVPVSQRDKKITRLIGRIPYLNGGLFELHILEADGNEIQIADEAFESVFAFFDQYEWTLDTRAIERVDGKEINPDVLGYIFEKYINQKQMGAYYTKEDITDYITKNTVIPWLFQNAQTLDKVAFEPDGAVWRLLAENPESYIYPAVSRGTELELPPEISAGIDDVSARGEWNKDTDSEYKLPQEVWRETIARRQRHEKVREKIKTGQITNIQELITYNLDIRQFAQDAIQFAESPDLVRAFWKGISSIKVLDPACGSGAFLFSALGILYSLYDACLDRMEQFTNTAPEPANGQTPLYPDFRDVLRQVSKHPNRTYYIYKSIIISNLYGVDIMDEAVEICKLRLFLKLAAQLESSEQIEPLPDIDFNIRTGNSLVGYTSLNDVKRAIEDFGFDFDDQAKEIEKAIQDLDKAFQLFRQQQKKPHGTIESDHKSVLRRRLTELGSQLDRFLANDYGVKVDEDVTSCETFKKWKSNCKPFHWVVEFYGIISEGGFDVVVGNPPYVKSSKIKNFYTVKGYSTEKCPDIYAWMMERSTNLISNSGSYGMIVPLSFAFSGDFQVLRDHIFSVFNSNWFSSFARIPASLFSAEVRIRNTIHIGHKNNTVADEFTTNTHRWFHDERPHLIECLEYAKFNAKLWNGIIPRLGRQQLLSAIEHAKENMSSILSSECLSRKATGHSLFFKKSAYKWLSISHEEPPSFSSTEERIPQPDIGKIFCKGATEKNLIHTYLNGKIAFLWWAVVGDDFHLTKKNFDHLPVNLNLSPEIQAELSILSTELKKEMRKNIVFKLNAGKKVGSFNLTNCRHVTDKSDQIWASMLGLDTLQDEIELLYQKIVKTSC